MHRDNICSIWHNRKTSLTSQQRYNALYCFQKMARLWGIIWSTKQTNINHSRPIILGYNYFLYVHAFHRCISASVITSPTLQIWVLKSSAVLLTSSTFTIHDDWANFLVINPSIFLFFLTRSLHFLYLMFKFKNSNPFTRIERLLQW